MQYTDRVYGEFEILESVILELINCPVLQRLKEIDQVGYKPLWSQLKGDYDFSRFDHSVGVYLLLYKYKAPLEEQIAGLIHDVSHSAFSHCIEYVLDCGSAEKHDYQDKIFDSFIRKSEIPEILKKYNFDLDYILNESNFPLKEKDLPGLCADRIDYSLRTAIIFKEANSDEIKYLLDNLTAENNNWVFKNFESAREFSELFFKLNTKHYSGIDSAIMFRTIGDFLKYALGKGYITENDLYTTDKLVIKKIEKFLDKDKELKLFFERMNNKIKITNNPHNYNTEVFCKSRIVDPLFKDSEKLRRISAADSRWAKIVAKESEPKQYFLKFER